MGILEQLEVSKNIYLLSSRAAVHVDDDRVLHVRLHVGRGEDLDGGHEGTVADGDVGVDDVRESLDGQLLLQLGVGLEQVDHGVVTRPPQRGLGYSLH